MAKSTNPYVSNCALPRGVRVHLGARVGFGQGKGCDTLAPGDGRQVLGARSTIPDNVGWG